MRKLILIVIWLAAADLYEASVAVCSEDTRYSTTTSSSSSRTPRRMLLWPQAADKETTASLGNKSAAVNFGWLPDTNSDGSGTTNSDNSDRVSDWFSSIAGPTAIITSPTTNQQVILSSLDIQATGVWFDGRQSQPLIGTELVSWDWDVVGQTDQGRPYQTSFVGATRLVTLPPGTYSATLTVQAVQLRSGSMSGGSDYVACFTVKQ